MWRWTRSKLPVARVGERGGRTTWARSAQWFQTSWQRRCDWCGFDPDHRRVSDLQWTGGVEALNQFSDGYPSLVLGQPSLDEFNRSCKPAAHRL
jgi:uncharacterized protein YcbX